MREYLKLFIGGEWVDPEAPTLHEVVNPATELVCGRVALGSAADVDKAVRAASRAFASFSQSSREERVELLLRIVAEYQRRFGDLVAAITEEMGAPTALAQQAQVPIGQGHFMAAAEALKRFHFEEDRGPTRIVREPIGVCGLITPWNWPLNQIAAKVAPAIATGCTMVLKPSELAPFSGQVFTEILQASGVPAGVFNLVQGDGPEVGVALSRHPGVDMISFTGSTRAGIEVARNAAPTVKRVHQELGGKSPNIILDDEAFASGVARGVAAVMTNSGQTCSAPTRMLVPKNRMAEAADIAKTAVQEVTVGDPTQGHRMGPVVSRSQFDKVQELIRKGIEEGASLVAGGPGRPDGLDRGFYVKPTVFTDVTNDMTIAQQEIFGPVLVILSYEDVGHAVEIANDTQYGLGAYVNGADLELARKVANGLRAGQVYINGAFDMNAPFGGYKMSGNGREWGDYAFHEFLETKAVLGWASVQQQPA